MASTRCLEHLLTCRLSPVKVHTLHAQAGAAERESVVPTDRLIWLTQGRLSYRIEQMDHPMAKDAMWLVPAWTRRSWRPTHADGCDIAWVEFIPLPGDVALPGVRSARPSAELRRLRDSFLHHHAASRQALAVSSSPPSVSPPQGDAVCPHALLAEAALQSCLMLLVHQGRPYVAPPGNALANPALPAPGRLDELGELASLIADRLADPHLLADLPRLAHLSPSRLRARFRRSAGMAPGQYLETLRMRQARYLLMTTTMGVKQVAAQVGYDDPLYFSRRYRLHWRKPPTQDRSPSP